MTHCAPSSGMTTLGVSRTSDRYFLNSLILL